MDTSGSIPLERCKQAIDLADLLLLDIKALDPVLCHTLTGESGENAKALLEYRQAHDQPVWIRHVLIPGYTLEQNTLEQLAGYLATFTCIERVDLLPFHQLGRHKWALLNTPYPLENTQSPDPDVVTRAKEFFRSYGLKTF